MKHTLFLILCLFLLLEVCAKGGRGGGSRSSGGGKSGGWSWSRGSTSSSSSSSSSSGGNKGSNSQSTHQSGPKKPVKHYHGHGPVGRYPTSDGDEDRKKTNMQGNPNWNPNNRVMSPHYAGSYAYGGYGRSYNQGPSPFAKSVQSMGYNPSVKSKGFGKTAVVAAGTGAMAGMAVGYGLGSYPRPHFSFHDPQQEYYYNHYMYQKYGSPESGNTNKRTHTQTHGHSSNQGSSGSDSRPPDLLKPPPKSFDSFMTSCMKRKDLLPSEITENKSQANKNKTLIGAASPTATPKDSAKPSQEVKKEGGQENETEDKRGERKDNDEEVVSILEIGYPALIKQLKERRCVELYVVYTEAEAVKQAYGHGAKPSAVDIFSSSFMCLIGFLLLY